MPKTQIWKNNSRREGGGGMKPACNIFGRCGGNVEANTMRKQHDSQKSDKADKVVKGSPRKLHTDTDTHTHTETQIHSCSHNILWKSAGFSERQKEKPVSVSVSVAVAAAQRPLHKFNGDSDGVRWPGGSIGVALSFL